MWSSLVPYFVFNPKSKVLHHLCFRFALACTFTAEICVEQMCRPLIQIWWHFPVFYLVCRVWAEHMKYSKPLLILIIGYFYTKLHNKWLSLYAQHLNSMNATSNHHFDKRGLKWVFKQMKIMLCVYFILYRWVCDVCEHSMCCVKLKGYNKWLLCEV